MASTTDIKPITLYGNGGPNPPKVAFVLEFLSLPYTTDPLQISQVKEPHYVAINPNGRVPAIVDPNTNVTLWESGAILEYLVETYDTDHKISFPKGSPESYLTKQWLFYQVSGQGPYFGQIFWFRRYHPEKVPSAEERYIKEANRVTGVLDAWLAKQKEEYAGKGGDGPWLVGNKFTFADVAFVPWQFGLGMGTSKEEFDWEKYPVAKEWFDKMLALKEVEKIMASFLKK